MLPHFILGMTSGAWIGDKNFKNLSMSVHANTRRNSSINDFAYDLNLCRLGPE